MHTKRQYRYYKDAYKQKGTLQIHSSGFAYAGRTMSMGYGDNIE